MASVLYVEESVVTGDILVNVHSEEEEVCVSETAIVTPTGWDYLRNKRLRLIRGSKSKKAIPQELDSKHISQNEMDGIGRCDQPESSCGCVDEEFGSGFVEPSSCHDCSIHELKRKGDQSADCYGCNRRVLLDKLVESGSGLEPEQLIREVTSAVAQRLER
ncbi:MAG: hypothetical protein CME10_03340 [Gemmatimonadetes bacterium]|jgi:hypothetical protein|nr:hypothetical protein [Gemmatimonadota bacterium]